MSSERRYREALGVGLLAAAVLVALAAVSPLWSEEGDNLVGPAGRLIDRVLDASFGIAGVLIVVPAVAWAFHGFEWVERETAIRLSVLAGGLLVLVPAGLWLALGDLAIAPTAGAAPDPGQGVAVGWVGRVAGGGLAVAFGPVGAGVVLLGLLAALAVLTLGWSPSQLASRVARGAGAVAAGTADALSAAGRAGASFAGDLGDWLAIGSDDGASPWEPEDVRAPETMEEATDPPAPDEPAGRGVEAPASREAGREAGGDTPEARPPLDDYGDPTSTDLPPLDLLTRPEKSSSGLSDAELRKLSGVLIDKLASFRVEGEIQGWTTGPVVTQFEVVPASGVKVGQIAARADDLALAMKAPSVRIVAPIPGKGAVGVEVPNPEPEIVQLREVLESPAYQRSRAALPLALGRDLAGEPYCTDLARMPHLLIAGATGSGKSVCINTIITSLIYRYPPRQLRLLMIDPKMVELSGYDDLPHLRHPVVTDNQEAASVLKWAKHEMNRRYELLSVNGARSLREFNRRVAEGREIRLPDGWSGSYEDGELPYVVLLVDELADLMMTVQGDVEGPLAMLAQKARAVGIHLVIATQRPSVNVITGLIKANFPSRIAFRVASKTDSRTILDQNGAESLLGNGDMLFLPPGEADPVRIQGAFIPGSDTERLVEWYRRQMPEELVGERFAAERDILSVVEEMEEEDARVDVVEEVLEDRDELFRQAAEIVIANDSGSTSLLQRRLRIGYGRAARIIDQLHHAGVVGPSQGSQPREVQVSADELDEVLSEQVEE